MSDDLARTASRLLDEHEGYRWRGVRDPVTPYDDNAQHILPTYAYLFTQVADEYRQRGDAKRVKAILTRMNEVLGPGAIGLLGTQPLRDALNDLYEYAGLPRIGVEVEIPGPE
jgi:hypothetical protein